MEYKYAYDEETGVCTVNVFGDIRRPDDSMELQRFALAFREEHGCGRFLFDMTEANIIGVTMDMYKIGMEPVVQGFSTVDFKVANVYSGDIDKHRFMESILLNRGYDFRVFDNFEEAFEWLTRRSSSTKESSVAEKG